MLDSPGLSGLRVFISYRRGDSTAYAGRLFDALAPSFPDRGLFMDIDSILPGTDFAESLQAALADCDAILALIGPNWADAADKQGSRRLDDPQDFVRLELETALKRKIPLIPLLVQGADMPTTNHLPASLHAFCRRQALDLSDRRWRADVAALVDILKIIEVGKPSIGEAPSKPAQTRLKRPNWKPRPGLRSKRSGPKVAPALQARRGPSFNEQVFPSKIAVRTGQSKLIVAGIAILALVATISTGIILTNNSPTKVGAANAASTTITFPTKTRSTPPECRSDEEVARYYDVSVPADPEAGTALRELWQSLNPLTTGCPSIVEPVTHRGRYWVSHLTRGTA